MILPAPPSLPAHHKPCMTFQAHHHALWITQPAIHSHCQIVIVLASSTCTPPVLHSPHQSSGSSCQSSLQPVTPPCTLPNAPTLASHITIHGCRWCVVEGIMSPGHPPGRLVTPLLTCATSPYLPLYLSLRKVNCHIFLFLQVNRRIFKEIIRHAVRCLVKVTKE